MDKSDRVSRYWDPLPDVRTSAGLTVPGGPIGWSHGLGEPAEYLCGKWTELNWRNVPGPLYGAGTDTCWASREYAPHNISYENEHGQEFLYRQPRTRSEVLGVLCGAANDPFFGWGWDGDDHWTPDLVRDWWRERRRLTEWITADLTAWTGSDNAEQREAINGLIEYSEFISVGLEAYLRGYLFWLTERTAPASADRLPAL